MPARIIYQMAESPFPPSYQGSGLAYGLSIFSLLLVTMVGFGTVTIAARNVLRPTEFSLERITHVAFLLAAIGATARCAADAMYKMAWGEVSAITLANMMLAKNIIDSVIVFPVVGWMALYGLMLSNRGRGSHRGVRYTSAVILVGIIAAVFASSKV